MNTKPIIGIGNRDAQQKFIAENRGYFDEWPLLEPVIERVFLNRSVNPPSDEALAAVAHLPEDNPEVLAIEDKYKADLIVYMLGRIAVDDFSEIVVLAGNGWGIGAWKLVRGMYERVVTSAHIAKAPAASRAFAASIWTHSAKVLKRVVALDPAYVEDIPTETVDTIRSEAKKAQDAKNESVCKHCGQIKKVEAWTALDLASMARDVGQHLEELYLPCYLESTAHMHATGAGVSARMQLVEEVWGYRMDTTKEARTALHLGHNLILQNIGIQNDYSNLGLDDLIRPRLAAFVAIWGKAPSPDQG